MIYKKFFFAFVACLFLLIGCGQNGEDGDAYISFTWNTTPEWYYDDNPSVPSTIHKNRDYNTEAGKYEFSYKIYDSHANGYWTYSGNYKITINQGKKGSFLVDGDDGADKYFALYLGVNGPEISIGKILSSNGQEYKNLVANLKKLTDKNYLQMNIINQTQNKGEKLYTRELQNDDFKIEICYRKFIQ